MLLGMSYRKSAVFILVEYKYRNYSMFKISFTTTEILVEDINSLLPKNYQGLETHWGLAVMEIIRLSDSGYPMVLISPANTEDASDYPIGVFELSNSIMAIDWIGYNNYSTPHNTFAFDLNNDDLLDVFVPGSSGHNPTGKHGEIPFLGINRGTGFEDVSEIVFSEISSTADWAYGDFDGNGFEDILLLNVVYDEYNPLTNLYLNNGDESFTSRRDLLPSSIAGDDAMSSEGPKKVNFTYRAMDTGDMDNDGDLDIVVAESVTGRWDAEIGFYSKKIPPQIWENDGKGKFRISDSVIPLKSASEGSIQSVDLKLWDITGNGYLEIIYPADDHKKNGIEDAYKTSDLVIYSRLADGNYKNITSDKIDTMALEFNGYWPASISIIDVNNDMHEDIVVTLSPWGGLNIKPSAIIYYNNGNGYFAADYVEVLNDWAGSFQLFNDGSDDVIDAFQLSRGTTVEGNGSFLKITGVLNEVRSDRTGSAGDDLLVGFGDGASISPLEGNDKIVGANGLDIVVFNKNKDDSIIQIGNDGSFQSVGFGSEINTLISIERIKFLDRGIALDLSGNAGTTAKILGAFLGGSGIQRADLVGVGLDLLDSGTTYEGFLQAALDAVFGQNPSGATLVNHFYGTLTGQSAPQSLIEQYGSLIDNGSLSPVSLAMQVAENELNLQNIDLVGLATTGIEYT
jgi:hypothetical protein